jgi:hypothetical protein
MFTFIRKHQGWGLVFIGLVIVSFIVWFSPYSQLDQVGPRAGANYGAIGGVPVSADDYFMASKEARLEYLLRFGAWPDQDSNSRQMGYNPLVRALHRLVLIRRLEALNIRPTEEAIAEQIADYFRNRSTASFELSAYDRFTRETLVRGGVTRNEFERFVGHQVGIRHLAAVAGLGGDLVTPREAESTYKLQNEQIQASAVLFALSNYVARVTNDPAAIATFYTNEAARYRIPERIQVSYVRFAATNYLAEAEQQMTQDTNLTQAIEFIYQQRGTNFYRDEQGQPLAAPAAKDKVRREMHEELGLRVARRKAAEFATKLFDQPAQPDALDKLAAAEGLTAQLSEPFGERDIPRGMNVPGTFSEKAFKLTPEEPFAPPVTGEGAVYIVALKQRIPSALPSLESVQARVAEDFRNGKARDLLREEAMTFVSNLTNALAQGKSVEDAANAASLTVVKPPPFSQATRSLPDLDTRLTLNELKMAGLSLSAGKSSQLVPSRYGGFVLLVHTREPAKDEQIKTELAAHFTELRQDRQFSGFNDWLAHEIEKARVAPPPGYAEEN